MKTKTLITSIAISITMMGPVSAADLSTMEGIPAEMMSHSDMNKVEGKAFSVPCVARSVCGSGGSALPGNWSWVSGLFRDIRTYYPQVWYPSFPLSYPGAYNFYSRF